MNRSLLLAIALCFLAGCGAGALRWNPDVHVVREGETLYSIAWRHGVDYRDLAAWNRIPPGFVIYPGQELSLNPRRVARASASAGKNTPTATARSGGRTVTAPKSPPPANSGIAWQWPTRGRVVGGFSDSNVSGKGIDIAGDGGQPVVAAAEGKVVYSGSGLIGYGKIIIVKHSDHFLSAYGHNSKIVVKEGQVVKAGQKIATMGQGPGGKTLLHFEIRYNGQAVDPTRYLPAR